MIGTTTYAFLFSLLLYSGYVTAHALVSILQFPTASIVERVWRPADLQRNIISPESRRDTRTEEDDTRNYPVPSLSDQIGSTKPVVWDSTYRPSSYALKVEQFKAFPNSPSDIIFLGNSITERIEWSELLNNTHTRNRGISGDITFGVLERLVEVIEGKPAKVFLLIGINDIARGIPDSVIVSNYAKIIQRLKKGSPVTTIYIQTILPTNNTFTQFNKNYDKNEHIRSVNQQLRELAVREGVMLIDLYTEFVDQDNRLVKEYTSDGLHLTLAGYRKWAEVLEKGLYL